MTVPNFISKSFSYQDLRRGMIRQKYPGTDGVNKDFEETFLNLSNKHASFKQKTLRQNNSLFVKQELCK